MQMELKYTNERPITLERGDLLFIKIGLEGRAKDAYCVLTKEDGSQPSFMAKIVYSPTENELY